MVALMAGASDRVGWMIVLINPPTSVTYAKSAMKNCKQVVKIPI